MSIIEFRGARITHRYLMNKTKDDLARMYMDLLDASDEARRERDRLRKALHVYGRHVVDDGAFCELLKHSEYPCTCGFSVIEAALAADGEE